MDKRWWVSTDVEEQGGDGSVVGDMDHAQVIRQVALSGAHEEQPFLETKKHAAQRRWAKNQSMCVDSLRSKVTEKQISNCDRSPRGRQDGGVESSETGKSHGQGNGPVHHTEHLVRKRLEGENKTVSKLHLESRSEVTC